MPEVVFTPVTFPQVIGKCVYCGRDDVPLSDEHVVPYALHGTWTLTKASCEAHRNLTSALETEVLHNAFEPARAAFGLRTRHKKRRRSTYPIRLGTRKDGRTIEVPIDEHPGMLALPIFAPPGTTPDATLVPGTPVLRFAVAGHTGRMKALATAFNTDTFGARYPDPVSFARFLAKIAHCYAVACVGVSALLSTPLLATFLAGGPAIFRFVGTNQRLSGLTRTNKANDVALVRTDEELIAHVRLFAPLRGPEYAVHFGSSGAA